MPKIMQSTLWALLACSALMAVSGCEDTIKPFNLTIGEVGEPTPPRHAQIVFSSPRVYARETLINDRLTEIDYLTQALTGSKTATFGPELKRELESISSLAVQLRAAFNPAAGAAFEDAQRLNDLQQEIDRTQLTIQLETLQRQLDALKAADEEDEAKNEGQKDEEDEVQTGLPENSTDVPELSELDEFQNLVANVETLRNELSNLAKNISVSDGTSELTPEETYRRRRDHRAEIRADLAASRLDDVHGANGNGLYRTQFLASVVPPSGSDSNRWGVARMVVEPPRLTESEVQSLYFDWLAHVTGRLNRVRAEAVGTVGGYREVLVPDALYDRLGANTELYAIARIEVENNCGPLDETGKPTEGSCVLTAAVPDDLMAHTLGTPLSRVRKNLRCIAGITSEYRNLVPDTKVGAQPSPAAQEPLVFKLLTIVQDQAADDSKALARVISGGEGESTPADCKDLKGPALVQFMKRLIEVGPTVQAMYRSLGERIDLPDSHRQPALQLLGEFDRAASNAVFILLQSNESIDQYRQVGRTVPARFCTILFNAPCPTEGTVPAAGDTLAIAVTPTDEAQRVSTLQRAAHAMQLALGLAATVPQSGINLQGGVNYLNAAAGSVDALERVPRVIGFAGRQPRASTSTAPERAAFGWLFGPEVGVDSESNQLELRQTAMDRIVTADVSVPGWWPRMTLKVETLWGGELDKLQFTDGGSLNRTGSLPTNAMGGPVSAPHAIEVALPLNSADLDGLTGLLARRSGHGGRQQVRIDWVEPETIRSCTAGVTMVVQGSELWREPRAFLAGIGNTGTIEVLPDMGGLLVTFDFSKLAERVDPKAPEREMLTVWTRGGEARWPIKVACKQPKEEMAKKEKPPESFERNLAATKAAAESATKDFKDAVAKLRAQLKAIADVSKDPAKTIDAALVAIDGKADGLLTKAVNDDGGKKGLTKLIAEAKPIDGAVAGLLIDLDRAKLLGQSTADIDAEIAGRRGVGTAKLIRANDIKTAFDQGMDKLTDSGNEVQTRIEKLNPAA